MQNEQYQCAQSLMLLIIHLFCIYMKKSMFEVQKFHKDTTEWEQNQLGPEDTLFSISVLTSLSNFHLTASLMIVVHVLPPAWWPTTLDVTTSASLFYIPSQIMPAEAYLQCRACKGTYPWLLVCDKRMRYLLKMTGSEWPYRPQFHLEMHPLLLPADAS